MITREMTGLRGAGAGWIATLALCLASGAAAERSDAAEGSSRDDDTPVECVAVYLDGQGGEELGRRSYTASPQDVASLGVENPLQYCLGRAFQDTIEGTMAVECSCD